MIYNPIVNERDTTEHASVVVTPAELGANVHGCCKEWCDKVSRMTQQNATWIRQMLHQSEPGASTVSKW